MGYLTNNLFLILIYMGGGPMRKPREAMPTERDIPLAEKPGKTERALKAVPEDRETENDFAWLDDMAAKVKEQVAREKENLPEEVLTDEQINEWVTQAGGDTEVAATAQDLNARAETSAETAKNAMDEARTELENLENLWRAESHLKSREPDTAKLFMELAEAETDLQMNKDEQKQPELAKRVMELQAVLQDELHEIAERDGKTVEDVAPEIQKAIQSLNQMADQTYEKHGGKEIADQSVVTLDKDRQQELGDHARQQLMDDLIEDGEKVEQGKDQADFEGLQKGFIDAEEALNAIRDRFNDRGEDTPKHLLHLEDAALKRALEHGNELYRELKERVEAGGMPASDARMLKSEMKNVEKKILELEHGVAADRLDYIDATSPQMLDERAERAGERARSRKTEEMPIVDADGNPVIELTNEMRKTTEMPTVSQEVSAEAESEGAFEQIRGLQASYEEAKQMMLKNSEASFKKAQMYGKDKDPARKALSERQQDRFDKVAYDHAHGLLQAINQLTDQMMRSGEGMPTDLREMRAELISDLGDAREELRSRSLAEFEQDEADATKHVGQEYDKLG
ncbi:hypothetical protein EXS71_03840, partial [Candidatus Uhrbacteria bacterium]|nr:hypothetical protein [Candidatus Uhrbacteria bacterium]